MRIGHNYLEFCKDGGYHLVSPGTVFIDYGRRIIYTEKWNERVLTQTVPKREWQLLKPFLNRVSLSHREVCTGLQAWKPDDGCAFYQY